MRDGGDRRQETTAAEDADGPVGETGGSLQARLQRLLGNRPLSVYGVLLAGVGVLVLLLAIVVVTATGDNGSGESPQCLPTAVDEATRLIEGGQVERVIVVADEERPEAGPAGLTLRLVDTFCRTLPLGTIPQPDLYRIIGVVDYANSQRREGEERIGVRYERQLGIPPQLFDTPTPPPTLPPVPPPTAVPTAAPPPPPTAVAPPATPILAVTATLPATVPPATPAPDPASPTTTTTTPSAAPATGVPASSPAATVCPLPPGTRPPD